MAKEPVAPTTDDEWEEVQVGIGDEWDFQKGDLVGTFLQARIIDLPEQSQTRQDDGTIRDKATIFEFALDDPAGEVVFLWESYQISEGLKDATSGSRIKIHYEGMQEIQNGARRVKKYKFFVKK